MVDFIDSFLERDLVHDFKKSFSLIFFNKRGHFIPLKYFKSYAPSYVFLTSGAVRFSKIWIFSALFFYLCRTFTEMK